MKPYQVYNSALKDKRNAVTEQQYEVMKNDILKRAKKSYKGKDKITIKA